MQFSLPKTKKKVAPPDQIQRAAGCHQRETKDPDPALRFGRFKPRTRSTRAQQTAREWPNRLQLIGGASSSSGGAMVRRCAVPTVAMATLIHLLLLLVAAESVASHSSNDTDAAQALRAGGDTYDREGGAWARSTGSGYSFSGGSSSSSSSSAGHIAFVPERVDFGRVHACALRSFFVSIENRGPRRVKLQRADFTRENLALATDVAGIHLDPGGRFLVELRYLPAEPASHYGAFFRVLTSSGRFALPIHSRIEPNPAGAQALRVTVPIGASVHHTITLRNPKASPLRVTDVFTFEDHLHLTFPGGESAITPRRPDQQRHRDQEHAEQQAEDTHGVWEFAPGASKPLVTLSFRTEEPGVFLSYVNIHADGQPYLMVPVRVTVLRERALTVEPSVIDVGVLTSRRQPHRELVTVYNTLASPVTIDGVRVSPTSSKSSKSSSLAPVDVRMVEEPFLLPSRTRADVTLELEFPDNNSSDNSNTSDSIETRSAGSRSDFIGDFDAALALETSIVSDDSSKSDSPPRPTSMTPLGVRIVGKKLHGSIAYRQRDTLFALTLPLTHAFPPESSQDRINEMEMNVSIPLPMSVMPLGDATTTSTLMEAGTRLTQTFRLQNQFDAPLELQRVYIDGGSDGMDNDLAPMSPFAVKEVALNHFNRSVVAAPGTFWPALPLDLSPSLERDDLALRGDGELLAPRAYSLVVETNATIHEIPLHFYHGIVRVRATRGLSRHALSGFVNESTLNGSGDWMKTTRTERTPTKNIEKTKKKTKPKKKRQDIEQEVEDDHLSRTCASVYGGEGHTVITDMLTKPRASRKHQRKSKNEPLSPFGVRVCRSLQFDLGKIALRGDARALETLTITNWNPIPIEMALSRVAQPELFTLDIHAEMKTSDVADCGDDCVPEALSTLHAQWQANASFVRSNERRLAALSTHQHDETTDDGDGDASSSSFVVPPGHSVAMHLDMKLAGTLGTFTAHVLTLRTPFEVIHVHAFLDIIDGIVEPVQAEVELSPAFAGQAQMVELHYRNTFNHAVRITNVTVPNGMAIATIADTIPARSEKALTLYFVPSDIQVCAGRRMVVDCLLPPLDVPVGSDGSGGGDGRNHALSDFGTYVSPSDLIALARRNEFWTQVASHNSGAAVLKGAISGLVELETDLMRDVPPVTLSIPLARPRIVVSGVTQPVGDELLAETASVDSDSKLTDAPPSVPVKVHFPMTQLFYVSHAFVNVSNPANSTINAELVCAYAQRLFFYMCDEQSDDAVDDDRECLDKWRALVVDAASRPTCGAGREGSQDGGCNSGLTVDAPLFSFRHRIVEIPPGEHALLGPIYYLPGYTHQVTAELYVRNQLSHIEPIHLVASSGKPTLSLSVLTPVERGISVKNSSGVDSKDEIQRGGEHRGNNILEFAVDEAVAGVGCSADGSPEQRPSDFSRRANLQIANTGEFDLRISKVWMVDRTTGSDDDNQVGDALPFEIVAFPGHITLWRSKHTEDGTHVVGENGAFAVLKPGVWLQFGIVFRPTCLTATTQVDVLMETNDDRRVIPLTGTITSGAAFECLRQRTSRSERLFLRALWALSVLIGSSCILLVLVDVVRTVVVSSMFPFRTKRAAPEGGRLVKKETTALSPDAAGLAVGENDAGGGSDADESGTSEVGRLLSEMEQAPFKPTLPVSLSAVNSVLERRQRGAFDPAAILKSLGGNSEQMDGDPKTPERSNDGDAPAPRLEQGTASGSDKRGSSSNSGLLEFRAPLTDTATPETLAVENPTANKSDETAEHSEKDMDDTMIHPSVRLTPAVEAEDLAASSHSTATVKSIDSDVGSRVGGSTGQHDNDVHHQVARDQQAGGVEATKIEGENDKSSNDAGFSLSFGFPSLENEKDIGGKEASSKRDDDPAWSLWDSKSWWQTSTENNSLESNHSLSGAKERGRVLLPLRSLDSSSVLGISDGGDSSPALHSFAPSSSGASLHLDSEFSGVMLNNAASSTRSRAVSATKAPPGFTPADATPLEARAAFEKLRPGIFSASSGSGERLGDTSTSIRDRPVGLERGMLSTSNGLNTDAGALSLLAMLEPSSQPLVTPFSSGVSLIDSSSNPDGKLGGDHARTASLGEIGNKRLASFRDIWTYGGISGGDGASSTGAAATGTGGV